MQRLQICTLQSINPKLRNKIEKKIPEKDQAKGILENPYKNYKKIIKWKIGMLVKLYYGYKYTEPCMINHIWGLKQLWLQVNGHAWFHFQLLCWIVRNGEERKIQNENICLQRDSNPHHASPRQESKRLRPLGHEGLMVISGLMS